MPEVTPDTNPDGNVEGGSASCRRTTVEDSRLADKVLYAVNDCLLVECNKRCPGNQGYEPKCKYCDVKFVLDMTHQFKIEASGHGLFNALKWLIEAGHPQWADD